MSRHISGSNFYLFSSFAGWVSARVEQELPFRLWLSVLSWLANVPRWTWWFLICLAFVQAWRQDALWAAFSHFRAFLDLFGFVHVVVRRPCWKVPTVFSISVFDRAHVLGSFLPFRAFMILFGFVYGVVRLHVYGPTAFSWPVVLSVSLPPDSTSLNLNENFIWIGSAYVAAANSDLQFSGNFLVFWG